MTEILEKLITCCVPKINQKFVKDLIKNEEFHYIEPRHKSEFIDNMWILGTAIHDCKYIEIDYGRTKDFSVAAYDAYFCFRFFICGNDPGYRRDITDVSNSSCNCCDTFASFDGSSCNSIQQNQKKYRRFFLC